MSEKTLSCRYCKGDHLSLKCPTRKKKPILNKVNLTNNNKSKFIKKEEIPEQPDMSEYIHKKDIKKYIKDCPTCEECPTCPIPIENEKEDIDLSKYMLKSECKINKDKIDFGDLLPAFMKQKSTCTVEDDFRRTSFQKKC